MYDFKLRGRIDVLSIESKALRGNIHGDPHERGLPVYVPEGYDASNDPLPVAFDLTGFTGSGWAHLGWKAWDLSVPQRVEMLIDSGVMGPMLVAFPDCFTRLGGSQYINSPAVGQYEDYLIHELVPAVDEAYRTFGDAPHRGVFGKSSGGYGALVQGMRHPEVFGSVACHSGDMYFEYCYLPEFPKTLNQLAKHDYDIPTFLDWFDSKVKRTVADGHAMMTIAMAACYDPAPDDPINIRLPFKDMRTGEIDEARWANWLRWDPIRMIDTPHYQENLRSLECLFIDCGNRDQYFLHYGSRQFVEKLKALDIEHIYEEFDDDHSGIDYRMEESIANLFHAMMPDWEFKG